MKNKLILLLLRYAERNPRLSKWLHRVAVLNWVHMKLKQKFGKEST